MDGPLFAIGEVGYQTQRPSGRHRVCSATTRRASGTTTSQLHRLHHGRARQALRTSTRGSWGFYGLFDQVLVPLRWSPAATVVSASPARSSSRPINPSVRCLLLHRRLSSSAASLRRGRRTSAASASCTVTSAMTCKTPSGAPAVRSDGRRAAIRDGAWSWTYRLRFYRRRALLPARSAVHHPAWWDGPARQRLRGSASRAASTSEPAYRKPLV